MGEVVVVNDDNEDDEDDDNDWHTKTKSIHSIHQKAIALCINPDYSSMV